MSETIDIIDRVRLGAAWIKGDDKRIYCLGCGGLRRLDEQPCTCRLDAQERAS